jgi:hypothetical protein
MHLNIDSFRPANFSASCWCFFTNTHVVCFSIYLLPHFYRARWRRGCKTSLLGFNSIPTLTAVFPQDICTTSRSCLLDICCESATSLLFVAKNS